jgi:hypothetical protein
MIKMIKIKKFREIKKIKKERKRKRNKNKRIVLFNFYLESLDIGKLDIRKNPS